MAKEATIEGVVNELVEVNKTLWSTADLHLEALFNIESATNSVEARVHQLLKTPKIQDTLQEFSDKIIEGITGSFDAALEYQKKQDKQEDREEKGKVQGNDKQGFLGRMSESYQKGMSEGMQTPKFVTGLVDYLADLAILFGALRGSFGKVLTVLKGTDFLGIIVNFGKVLMRLALPITLAIGAINGLIDAFKAFGDTEGGLVEKLSTAIRAFFYGIIDVFAFIPDMIKGLLSDGIRAIFGDNFVSDFLDDFSFGDIPKRIVNVISTAIEGFLQVFREVFTFFGDIFSQIPGKIGDFFEEIFAGLKEDFPDAFAVIDNVLQSISDFFTMVGEKIDNIIGGLRSFFNIGDEKKDEEFLNLTNDEQRDELESARRSGLYDKNLLVKSTIDPEKIAAASDKQLQAILDDDDINEASKELIEDELRERLGPREIDKQMSSESNVTTNNNNSADHFKTERVETEGRVDGTAKLAGYRPQAYYGSVKSARGKTRSEMTKYERAQVRAAGDGGARIDVPAPATTAESATPTPTLNEVTVPTREKKTGMSGVLQEVTVTAKAKKGTLGTAMKRKPTGEGPNEYVTKDPVSGKWRAYAPNLAAVGKPHVKLFEDVKAANEYTKSVDPEHEKMMADELAALDAEFGLTAPEADSGNKISGAQGAAAQSGELEARQNDLSTAQAQQQQSASNVAVVDNSQQQSVVNNNTTSGVNPSPFDKSDRTHKRGAYRGIA